MVSVAHAGILFAANNATDHLFTIDTGTLVLTDVGAFGTNVNFGGMAYDPNLLTLYLIGGRGNQNLYTVNQSTGAASLVGGHGVRDLFGLAYDSLNDRLYGSQFSGGSNLFSLNTGTGAPSLIGNMGRGLGGLAYNSSTDDLVGMQDGAGDIYSVNRVSAVTTLLHNGSSVNDSGLAYDPVNNLYWDIDFSGNLFSYDIAGGFTRTTHLSGLGSYDGLTYKSIGDARPVPEPGTLTLFGLSLLGLGAIRRRRAKAA